MFGWGHVSGDRGGHAHTLRNLGKYGLINMKTLLARAVFGVSMALLLATSTEARAAQFLFQLHNHPDGNVLPPPYGARIDELYNATSGNDVFTFDFDAAGSDMRMLYDDTAQTIHIYGSSLGGRDIGSVHASDSYLGFYEFDFLYSVGVGQVPADDDIWSSPASDGLNGGTVKAPLSAGGQIFNLVDKGLASFGYTFRFGDENNDLGHRGFDGLSGWGWLEIDGAMNGGATRDWIFTAELIPEPATASLALFGVVAILRRRRR